MLSKRESLLVRGDCLEVMGSLPSGCVDSCIADPPYNMSKKKGLGWAFSSHVTMQEVWDIFSDDDYFQFCVKWIREVSRVVKPNGNILLFGTYHNIYLIGHLLQQMPLKILNSIIWLKPNAQPNITCRMFTESSEQVVWACNNPPGKAKNWTFNYQVAKDLNDGKQMRNYWSFPVTPKRERVGSHPSQKPEAVLERILLTCTNPGDLVLDPFAGTGTTGTQALKLGRRTLLIEKNEEYCKVILERAGKSALTYLTTAQLKRRAPSNPPADLDAHSPQI